MYFPTVSEGQKASTVWLGPLLRVPPGCDEGVGWVTFSSVGICFQAPSGVGRIIFLHL